MGYKYNAKGGIKGGISFEGALIADFDTVPQIKGEFNFVETVVYAFFKEGKRRSRTWEKVVFKKKEIWKGSIPNC